MTNKQLVIDRSRWLRGEGASASRLLRPCDGKMCCLGFYLESCGLTPEVMLDEETPFNVREKIEGSGAEWLLNGISHSGSGMALMIANDNMGKTDVSREGYIKQMFEEHGVDVTFVDSVEAP